MYFDNIVQAIDRIQSYIVGLDFEKFRNTNMEFDAVVFSLLIIGEASTHISDSFREAHPDIPWKDIRGMRNRIVHHYFDINEQTVWDVCTKELAPLREFFIAFLKD